MDPINDLQRTIGHGGIELFEHAPRLIEIILRDRLWEQRQDKTGQTFKSFEDFVDHRLWQGLETTMDELLLICRKRPDVQTALRAEIEPISANGTNQHNQDEGVTLSPPHEHKKNSKPKKSRGNSTIYTIGRLKRDRPDIAARVVSGDISANAGAVEAGFRRKNSKTPRTAFEEIIRLLPKLSDDERAKIHEMTAPKDYDDNIIDIRRRTSNEIH